MKRSCIIIMTVLTLGIIAGSAWAGLDTVTGKCVKVIDGDTLVIECDKNRRTVEIDGIDAPEIGQPWGKEVRSFVRDMVKGREVEVEIVESSQNVIRARVSVNGADLSELLVSRGLAWVPEGGDAELSRLSEQAKELPCGLWNDPDAQAPWDFRAAAS